MTEIVDDSAAAVRYNDLQQLYGLNFLANASGFMRGTEDRIEESFRDLLKGLMFVKLPGWNIVWGPRVYKQDPENGDTPPTNAWYVAKKGNRCVLAIAGTAPQSYTSWLQDFDVVVSVPWDRWVSKWPKQGTIPHYEKDRANNNIPTISRGTADGVLNILTSPSRQSAPGTYVQDFLRQQPAGTEIYLVGHSMGGALAPTVALGLVQSGIIPADRTKVVASAGASPGNTKFAEAFSSKLPYKNLYNTKDIVPQAWQVPAKRDRCFPNVYEVIFAKQKPDNLKKIKDVTINFGEKPSHDSGITYTPLPGDSFTSPLEIPVMDDWEKELPLVLRAQHGKEYLKHLGMADFLPNLKQEILNDNNVGYLEIEEETVPDSE